MTWMQAVVVVLITASALLPLSGLFGLYRSARERVDRLSAGQVSSNPDTQKWPVTTFINELAEDVKYQPRRVLWDFALIGGGVICGAVAGIWSLFPLS